MPVDAEAGRPQQQQQQQRGEDAAVAARRRRRFRWATPLHEDSDAGGSVGDAAPEDAPAAGHDVNSSCVVVCAKAPPPFRPLFLVALSPRRRTAM